MGWMGWLGMGFMGEQERSAGIQESSVCSREAGELYVGSFCYTVAFANGSRRPRCRREDRSAESESTTDHTRDESEHIETTIKRRVRRFLSSMIQSQDARLRGLLNAPDSVVAVRFGHSCCCSVRSAE